MNNCTFVGRLARDPDLKTTHSGTSVCKITIAVDRGYKNDEGKYEADFIQCTAWRKTAEFIDEWFSKGDPIAVAGSLQIRKYKGRDGIDRWASEVQIRDASFVPAPPKREQSWQEQVGATPVTEETILEPPADDQQLPFDF